MPSVKCYRVTFDSVPLGEWYGCTEAEAVTAMLDTRPELAKIVVDHQQTITVQAEAVAVVRTVHRWQRPA